ncbi:MAG TPA: dihydroneopterin aldolase [Actinomycetota bacterium]|nr:dihydroneopterin aldolase [Actinomycetota bacterium]
MTDTISVTGIRARGRHGVLAAERELGQPFVVDVQMAVDTAAAARADDLELTVDYAAVATEVVRIVGGPPVRLIETLAARIAERVRLFPGVRQVTVTVHKPGAPVPEIFEDVTVRITR